MVSIMYPIFSLAYIIDLAYLLKKEQYTPNLNKKYSIGVIVAARNEERNIKKCLDSILNQTYKPEKIIVVNDASEDKTSQIIKEYAGKIEIIDNVVNEGKSKSINKALEKLETDLVATIDADTILDREFFENIVREFEKENAVAACGYVLPNKEDSWIEKGRRLEYIYFQDFRKYSQSKRNAIYTLAGCCTVYKTELLKKYGIPVRTETEDMDLSWILQIDGYNVYFSKNAIAYTEEPLNIKELFSQLGRWYRGAYQVLYLNFKNIFKRKILITSTLIPIIEGVPYSIAFTLSPLILYFFPVWGISFLMIDFFSFLIPTLYYSKKMKRKFKFSYLPYYYAIKFLNSIAFIRGFFAFLRDIIKGKKVWRH